MNLEAGLQRLWYGPRWLSLPLWPVGWLYRAVVAVRRALYQWRLLPVERARVPVVVVGNLTVGGTGKTPVAAWLARQLGLRGHKVGVVLRGYGGRVVGGPRVVTPASDPADVGDEAVLHALRRPCVVVVGADRVAAARRAAEAGAEIVVCDDGLQHLRLARDFEIAVIDAARGLGNGQLLPAGPLREPPGRLERVDAVVLTERCDQAARSVELRRPLVATARLRLGDAVNLVSGEHRTLDSFRRTPLHAVAGVGNPGAFFDGLRAAGLDIVAHPLADHAALDAVALRFPAGTTVLMTEKDAVKCRAFAGPAWWFVELEVGFERAAAQELLAVILERTGLTRAGVHIG
jgi:tetraacyldisaccharide 4'-kinase